MAIFSVKKSLHHTFSQDVTIFIRMIVFFFCFARMEFYVCGRHTKKSCKEPTYPHFRALCKKYLHYSPNKNRDELSECMALSRLLVH